MAGRGQPLATLELGLSVSNCFERACSGKKKLHPAYERVCALNLSTSILATVLLRFLAPLLRLYGDGNHCWECVGVVAQGGKTGAYHFLVKIGQQQANTMATFLGVLRQALARGCQQSTVRRGVSSLSMLGASGSIPTDEVIANLFTTVTTTNTLLRYPPSTGAFARFSKYHHGLCSECLRHSSGVASLLQSSLPS